MIPFDSNRDRQDFRRGDGGSGAGQGPADSMGEDLSESGGWGGRLREFPDPGSARAALGAQLDARERAASGEPSGAWLLPPLMLSAIAAGVLFVLRGPDQLFGVVFGVVLGLGVLWILISSLFPARADRTCPQCGHDGLERLDPNSTHGLRCRLCAWTDESASGFLLAEEEGPLEDIVLRERRRGDSPRW